MSITLVGGYEAKEEDSLESVSSGAESGSGGGDLGSWAAGDDEKLSALVQGEYSNSSSFTLPAGIVGTGGFTTNFKDSRIPNTSPPSAESESGSGGGTLEVWKGSRSEKLPLAKGSYTNESSFSLPASVLNTGGYAKSAEENMGISFSGSPLGADGFTLSGTAVLLSDGDVIRSIPVDGAFIFSSPPLDGVVSGDNVEGTKVPTLDAGFVPKSAGVTSVASDIYPSGTVLSVSYGKIEGKVLDVDGDPVSGEVVSSPGVSTATDSDGNYSVLAPGGTTVSLTSLGQTTSKDVDAQGQSTTTVDFQYAGVKATVRLPNGKPAVGVPVSLDLVSGEKAVDDTGSVEFNRVQPNTTGTLTVFDSITEDVSILSGGQRTDISVSVGAGFTGRVVDSTTGRVVEGADVRAIADDIEYKGSNPSVGEYYVAIASPGAATIIVADEDRRFSAEEVEVDASGGETVEQDIELSRSRNIGNFG